MRRITLLAVTGTGLLLSPATASRPSARPSPPHAAGRASAPRLVSLAVDPSEVVIDRPQATQRLLVTGRYADGSERDLAAGVRFESSAPRLAAVSGAGLVSPGGNGSAFLAVAAGGQRVRVPVMVRGQGGPYRWDFAAQVAPVLAKAGCSGTSCHGSASGRAGFKLSAFGHDADADYEAIVRAAGGRRVNRQNPGASLLLLKPTMTLAHGGGLRFRAGSPEYRILARWIAAGAPRGGDTARVERLEVLPRDRVLTLPGQRQRLRVTARYSDGTREDVTDLALYEVRNAGVALDGAAVRAEGLGESAILARYGGQLATATVGATSLPPPRTFPAYDPANGVDREVFGKLRRLRLPPAASAADPEFVRRVYLDLAGRIPLPQEVERFCGDTDPRKREKLVDGLMSGPEFPRHWRDVLNSLLLGRAAFPPPADWAGWLETCLREDRGWDRMARELLLARPQRPEDTPALRFLDNRFAMGDTGLDQVTRDTSRIFFGVDIQCARCHTHPDVAAWQQGLYWGIAAFFGRTYRLPVKGVNALAERAAGEVEYFGPDKNKRVAAPVFLDGALLEEPAAAVTIAPSGMPAPENPDLYLVPPEEAKEKTRVPVPKYSRRLRFVELAVSPQNPYFRRAIVNRVWAELMGRGLVEPVDQMHAGNPACSPALLDGLAEDFAAHGFSLKRLVRTIVTSQAYGFTSAWPRGERPAPELFAVAAVRPLTMQQLSASLALAAGSGAAPGDAAAAREQVEKALAAELGELRRRLDSGTDVFQANVSQALYLSNSQSFQELLRKGGAAERLAKLEEDGEVVRRATLQVLGRPPDEEERAAFQRFLAERRDRRTAAVGQIVWALVTSSEFRFNH